MKVNKKLDCLNYDDIINKEKEIEYIIYIRKSTDEEDKQAQSIYDQLRLCINYVDNNWIKLQKRFDNKILNYSYEDKIKNKEEINNENLLKYLDKYLIVIERKSAKKSRKRAKWIEIIELIKKRKISGIISYHPDRQARNLLEAWELIDLVDEWYVDLKYTSFQFDWSSSWKMMLGILFVMAKHYTDKLSEDVYRWIISQFKNWRMRWKYKLWYYTDKTWAYIKDDKYYDILRQAFNMFIYKDKSKQEIVDFLNSSNFKVRKENNWKLVVIKGIKFKLNTISNILTDKFYYWMFTFHSKKYKKDLCVDLLTIEEINFEPLITKREYEKIIDKMWKKEHKKKSKIINLFRTGFIETADWYSCSFYIPDNSYKSLKKKYKLDNINILNVAKSNQIYMNLQFKSEIAKTRKK